MPSDLESDLAPHPQDPAMPIENSYCELADWGLLALSGEDTVNYLQGQITQDASQVAATAGQLAAHCNPKGRMLGLFRLIEYADGLGLLAPRALLSSLRQRLQLYVLRSRVRIDDVSDTVRIIGLVGTDIPELLSSHVSLPDAAKPAVHQQGIQLLRLGGEPTRWLLIGEGAPLEPLLQAITPSLNTMDNDAWRRLDILAGQPRLYADTREQFVPQMVNLDILGGISFKKGCYTGQEIVARSHYLGKIKRRMLRFDLSSGAASPGMAVFSAEAPGQAVGTVVDVAPTEEGAQVLLAVLRLENIGQSLHLESPDGPRLRLASLPYDLPELSA